MTKTKKTNSNTGFAKLINEHLSNLPKIGDIVKGHVISADKRQILIDIDPFTLGVIRGQEIKNLPQEYYTLEPNAELEAMVIDIDNEEGKMDLSLKAAVTTNAWQYVKDKEKNQEVIEIRVNGANKGGLLSTVRGMPAFLPVSQLTQDHYPKVEGGDKKKILKKLKTFIGKTLQVKIINFNPEEGKIILSEKRAWEETQKTKLKNYQKNETVQATAKAITNFGIFVSFGDQLEGLIHISEVGKTGDGKSLLDTIHVDDVLQPKIIDIKGTKVFLSLK